MARNAMSCNESLNNGASSWVVKKILGASGLTKPRWLKLP